MVKDFRQPAITDVSAPAAKLPDPARQRRTVLIGIRLSALMMVLFGVGLLVVDQPLIPADQASNVAMLCFVLAGFDLVMVQVLKAIWRKRDGA